MPMSERKDDGGQAFPGDGGSIFCGMSLREWFAGQALAGLAAYPGRTFEDSEPRHFARWSYALADAMIAERAK